VTFATLLAQIDQVTLAQLGEDVVYAPSVGDAEIVSGVFDEAYVRADAGNAGASSSEPAVFLTLADLPSDPRTDEATITIRDVAYAIREAKPDGQGGVLVFLQEA
jgi:hypothetical protein